MNYLSVLYHRNNYFRIVVVQNYCDCHERYDVLAADAAMLFGDADDITSDEDEQDAPAAASPASRRGSGDERDSGRERSRDRDEDDENRTSLPVIEDVGICEAMSFPSL
jgi:hypothetical protein